MRKLEDKAGGLFLYASLLVHHLKTLPDKLNISKLQKLPSGLPEIYEMNFGRVIRSKEQWVAYSRLISFVVAAREPLPVTLAREVTSMQH